MKSKTLPLLITSLVFVLALSACSALDGSADQDPSASGFIATDQIRVAPEVGGKVLTIEVAEGDRVQAGDVLFTLDDELLRAQAEQVQSAVDLADASVEAARAQLATTQVQYDLTLQQARLGDMQRRASAWSAASPDGFEQPVWYFEKAELMAAAQAEIDAASQDLDSQLANLAGELQNASNEDFVKVETRLAEARLAYLVADQTLEQAKTASDKESLETAAQDRLDAAEAELDSAQLQYDRLLSSSAAEAVLDARARVQVARTRLDNALDQLTSLQTGAESLQVEAARSAVSQAETAVSQSEANLIQAQASLNLVNLQLERCVVTASSAGTVLSLNIESGELVAAGTTALTLGQLEEVNLTVYVPEDQYGQISLEQDVSISVDSFPNRVFTGQVQYIADEAEFTPRNVQTVEGRKSTVFAVKIVVANPEQALKPGMPADVDFNLP